MVPLITGSHPGPEAAQQPQTITLPTPCFTFSKKGFFLKCGLFLEGWTRLAIFTIPPKFLCLLKMALCDFLDFQSLRMALWFFSDQEY